MKFYSNTLHYVACIVSFISPPPFNSVQSKHENCPTAQALTLQNTASMSTWKFMRSAFKIVGVSWRRFVWNMKIATAAVPSTCFPHLSPFQLSSVYVWERCTYVHASVHTYILTYTSVRTHVCLILQAF